MSYTKECLVFEIVDPSWSMHGAHVQIVSDVVQSAMCCDGLGIQIYDGRAIETWAAAWIVDGDANGYLRPLNAASREQRDAFAEQFAAMKAVRP